MTSRAPELEGGRWKTPGGDENFRRVFLAAALVVGITLLSLLAAALLMLCFDNPESRQQSALREGPASAAAAQPRLEISSGEELRKLRAEEDASMESYSWDRSTDSFRIPIERAIEIIAAEGLPSREKEHDARQD